MCSAMCTAQSAAHNVLSRMWSAECAEHNVHCAQWTAHNVHCTMFLKCEQTLLCSTALHWYILVYCIAHFVPCSLYQKWQIIGIQLYAGEVCHLECIKSMWIDGKVQMLQLHFQCFDRKALLSVVHFSTLYSMHPIQHCTRTLCNFQHCVDYNTVLIVHFSTLYSLYNTLP